MCDILPFGVAFSNAFAMATLFHVKKFLSQNMAMTAKGAERESKLSTEILGGLFIWLKKSKTKTTVTSV